MGDRSRVSRRRRLPPTITATTDKAMIRCLMVHAAIARRVGRHIARKPAAAFAMVGVLCASDRYRDSSCRPGSRQRRFRGTPLWPRNPISCSLGSRLVSWQRQLRPEGDGADNLAESRKPRRSLAAALLCTLIFLF